MATARGGSGNFNTNLDKVQLGNQSFARQKSLGGAMNHTMSQLRNLSNFENSERNNLSPTHPPRPDTETQLQRNQDMFFITKDTKPQVFDFRKTGTIQKSERGLLTSQRSTRNIISNLIDNRHNFTSQNLETKTSALLQITQNIPLQSTNPSHPTKNNFLMDAKWACPRKDHDLPSTLTHPQRPSIATGLNGKIFWLE